jgi:putative oxidoreductase
MFDQLMKLTDVPVRFLMAVIFVLSGLGKLGAMENTQAYMEAFGIPGVFLLPTIAFEIGVGILILIGYQTRYVAFTLSGFCIVSALIFHRDFSDMIQQIMFLKNMCMAGGFLLLAKVGTSSFSLDQYLASK